MEVACESAVVQGLGQSISAIAPEAGSWPLIVFSHSSGGGRRQSTFLCSHLSSHGYLVAALDHAELISSPLARQPGETPEQKFERQAAWIANRNRPSSLRVVTGLEGRA